MSELVVPSMTLFLSLMEIFTLSQAPRVNLVIDLGGNVHNLSLQPAKSGIFEFNFTLQLINHFLIAGAMVAGFWFIRLMGRKLDQ